MLTEGTTTWCTLADCRGWGLKTTWPCQQKGELCCQLEWVEELIKRNSVFKILWLWVICWYRSMPLIKSPSYVCTYCECNTQNCFILSKSSVWGPAFCGVPHTADWVWWGTLTLAKPRLSTSMETAVASLEGFQSLWSWTPCCYCCAVLSWSLLISWQMLGTVTTFLSLWTGREELGGRLLAYSSLRNLSLAGCC